MGEKIDFLSVTAEEAEHEELLRGIRMSTREKFEFFEEIIDLAWRTGAIKYLRSQVYVDRCSND
ncbi:MAG: hypothetical protein KGQ68_08945 [Gammaproteobacteria bacterium]|nr:hypothetical protein [Gammaproteobacteria bacterium]